MYSVSHTSVSYASTSLDVMRSQFLAPDFSLQVHSLGSALGCASGWSHDFFVAFLLFV